MIKIPHDCPRGKNDCIALANYISDDNTGFFCCGENDGKTELQPSDKYTVCFKGEFDDRIAHYDKRDLVHSASVIVQALAVIEKDYSEDRDWSPWKDL